MKYNFRKAVIVVHRDYRHFGAFPSHTHTCSTPRNALLCDLQRAGRLGNKVHMWSLPPSTALTRGDSIKRTAQDPLDDSPGGRGEAQAEAYQLPRVITVQGTGPT